VVNHSSYKNLYNFNPKTQEIIATEIEKFKKTLDAGLKQFEKGADPFVLFTSFGFPFELTKELAQEKGIVIDEKAFWDKFKEHQALSRGATKLHRIM
jgi:alanyl-tRNA synthetase